MIVDENGTYISLDDVDINDDILDTYDMNDTIELTNIIKPKVVTPIHYGTIVGRKEDGEKFKRLVENSIKVESILK